ncbi:MAG: hypothetical protein IH897_13810 [Planctomycetes bacterium]|nr:hypothetical protein [Planctomycetota bacterium]
MSRLYEANVSIDSPKPDREAAIKDALADLWGFHEEHDLGGFSFDDGLCFTAQNFLGGGQGDDEFAREVAHRVWAANQGFCNVEVIMIYIEDPPREEYVFDSHDEYAEWLKNTSLGRLTPS